METGGAVLLAAAGVLSLLIVLSNGLAMVLLLRAPGLHGACSHRLVFSLCLAQLLSGLVLPALFYGELVLATYSPFCVGVMMSTTFCCMVSILHQMLISLDRYVALSRPLRYPALVTQRRLLAAIAFSWIASLAVLMLNLLPQNRDVSANVSCHDVFNLPFFATFVACFLFLPVIVLVVTYVLIFRIARSHHRRLAPRLRVRGVEGEEGEEGRVWCSQHSGVGVTLLYTEDQVEEPFQSSRHQVEPCQSLPHQVERCQSPRHQAEFCQSPRHHSTSEQDVCEPSTTSHAGMANRGTVFREACWKKRAVVSDACQDYSAGFSHRDTCSTADRRTSAGCLRSDVAHHPQSCSVRVCAKLLRESTDIGCNVKHREHPADGFPVVYCAKTSRVNTADHECRFDRLLGDMCDGSNHHCQRLGACCSSWVCQNVDVKVTSDSGQRELSSKTQRSNFTSESENSASIPAQESRQVARDDFPLVEDDEGTQRRDAGEVTVADNGKPTRREGRRASKGGGVKKQRGGSFTTGSTRTEALPVGDSDTERIVPAERSGGCFHRPRPEYRQPATGSRGLRGGPSLSAIQRWLQKGGGRKGREREVVTGSFRETVRSTKMLAIMCCYFFLSWTPLLVYGMLEFTVYHHPQPPLRFTLLALLGGGSSFGNTVLYFFTQKAVRAFFMETLFVKGGSNAR